MNCINGDIEHENIVCLNSNVMYILCTVLIYDLVNSSF